MSKLTLSFKGTVLRVFPVLKGSMLIGSDPKCTLHIDSLAIEPQHARLDTQGDTTVLVDLDTQAGTFINNEPIKKQMLKDGDVIRVGKHLLTYQYESVPLQDEEPSVELDTQELELMPEAADTLSGGSNQAAPEKVNDEGKRLAWLQIMNGQNLGKTISLNRSMTNLGKPGVATAVITRRNDGYFLSHLEGDKPPLVDEKPIGTHSHKLIDGDTVQIGNIKMQFFLD
ncbi:MAG: FHA domain-containing protein [Gammaproteobacteria bacterium]|nr:FHA domain-containing protein [Gammaproteobacteria bacterium]